MVFPVSGVLPSGVTQKDLPKTHRFQRSKHFMILNSHFIEKYRIVLKIKKTA